MVLAASEFAATLSNERLRLTLAVRDWLVGEAHDISDPNVIIESLCLKLRDAGVPIDQAVSAVEFRHAERAANARIWEFGSPAREYIYGHDRGSEATESARSPRRIASTNGYFPGFPTCRTTPTTSSGR